MSASAARTPDAARSERERGDLALLAGHAAEGLLVAVLEAEGVELVDWVVHQVHHRPGVGVSVGWTVNWRGGDVVGEDYLVGTTAPLPTTGAGLTSVAAADRTVHVWRHPADPALPGLATASAPAAVASLIGERPDRIGLEMVTYRPLRRAVLRARTPVSTHYLKVVRPHTAEALHARHELLRSAGVPAARTEMVAEGVLLMEELPGSSLAAAFAADGAKGIHPEHVLRLLDQLPMAALELPRRPSWSDRVLLHAAGAAAAVPARAARIEELGRQIAELVSGTDPGPVVPTHGDLHEANVLVTGTAVSGLLDVDALGPGHRVDDLACLLGHLSVLPALAPGVHRHVAAALPGWVAVFERTVDPVGLRARAAAVALSLVAGATSGIDGASQTTDALGRVAAAEQWLESARRLRALSSPRPAPVMNGREREEHQTPPQGRKTA